WKRLTEAASAPTAAATSTITASNTWEPGALRATSVATRRSAACSAASHDRRADSAFPCSGTGSSSQTGAGRGNGVADPRSRSAHHRMRPRRPVVMLDGMRYRSSIAQDIDNVRDDAETGVSRATPLLVTIAAWLIAALAVVAVTAAVYLGIHLFV